MSSIIDQLDEHNRESRGRAFSSFTAASRTINAALLALAGAVLAGIGQLASGLALPARPAPQAISLALAGAMLSIAAGVAFVACSYLLAHKNYLLNHGKPSREMLVGRKLLGKDETTNAQRVADTTEGILPILAWLQLGFWIAGASGYAFTLYWVSRI